MALLRQDANVPDAVVSTGGQTGGFSDALKVLRTLADEGQAVGHVLARAESAQARQGIEKTHGSVASIVTPRLLLRAPTAADADSLALLANDRRVAENTARLPHPYTRTDALDWIGLTESAASSGVSSADSCRSFLVTLHDGTVIGGCGYGMLLEPVTEIGYWFGVPYWGQGLATEATQALVDHIFETQSDDVIAAGARVTNTASRRVIEKCGFTWSGVKLMRVRALATSVPIDRFRLTRADWARDRASAPPLQVK